MTTLAIPRLRARWRPLLLGGLAVGTADLLFACGFWAIRSGVPPQRILQSIAAGIEGRAAFEGGPASAALGALCHYLIATAMVLAYHFAGRRHPRLLLRPVRYGIPYGLLLYAVMTWVVVPLSNAAAQPFGWNAWVVSSVAMHAGLGVICAWCARSAGRP